MSLDQRDLQGWQAGFLKRFGDGVPEVRVDDSWDQLRDYFLPHLFRNLGFLLVPEYYPSLNSMSNWLYQGDRLPSCFTMKNPSNPELALEGFEITFRIEP